ncbi:MAG TPA: FGGY family carbohydrate kinase [Armatimonadota bacterium]|jgi:xylulokinase
MSNSSEALLGIDLGTSSVKTVLFDRGGSVLAAAQRDYPTRRRHPGWAEQDPREWWEATAATVRSVLAEAGCQPVAVGVTSQSSAVVALDEAGEPLRPAPLWLDRRAAPQCRVIPDLMPEAELIRLSGNRLDPSYILPKLLWLREEEPQIYAQTRQFLHANGYLIYRLTGAFTCDRTEGGMSLLYDMAAGDWSPEILARFDLPREKLPPLVDPAAVVGAVTAEAAAATGLAVGLPVVAGAMDLLAAALGAGVTEAGQSFLVIGTATVLATCLSAPQPHADLQMHDHALAGRWVHAANVDYGGAVLHWVRGVLGQAGAALSYEEMERLAVAAEAPGADPLFVPYMVGQRSPLWDDDCRGTIFGLRPEHTVGHLIRAAIEGNALALGRLQALQEVVHQRPIAEIRMAGGQSALPLVNQIVADVTNRPVVVMDAPEVTCHGAALLAGLGAGLYRSPAELTAALRVKQRYEPCAEAHERYADRQELLAEVYEALRPSLRRLKEEESRS